MRMEVTMGINYATGGLSRWALLGPGGAPGLTTFNVVSLG
jgi:hypothetical protein